MAIMQKIIEERDIKNNSSLVYNNKQGDVITLSSGIIKTFDLNHIDADNRFKPIDSTPFDIIVPVSDETTDLTTGTSKITFRMPFSGTLQSVSASVNTAPTGTAIIVDINNTEGSILSTKLTIDATEKTSLTATPAVISDSSLTEDEEIIIDIDQIGSVTAGNGLKVTLKGVRL